jgi:hypothetical protein
MLYDFMVTNDFLLGCLDALIDISALNLFFGVSSILLGPTILLASKKLVKQLFIGVTTGVAANLITKGLDSKGSSNSGSDNNNSGGKSTGGDSGGKSTGGDSGGKSTGGDSGNTNSGGKK